MLQWLRERRERRRRDRGEAEDLIRRHGDQTLAIVSARAQDPTLDERNRRHWARIADIIEDLSADDE